MADDPPTENKFGACCPPPQMGELMKECFSKRGGKEGQQPGDGFKNHAEKKSAGGAEGGEGGKKKGEHGHKGHHHRQHNQTYDELTKENRETSDCVTKVTKLVKMDSCDYEIKMAQDMIKEMACKNPEKEQKFAGAVDTCWSSDEYVQKERQTAAGNTGDNKCYRVGYSMQRCLHNFLQPECHGRRGEGKDDKNNEQRKQMKQTLKKDGDKAE